MSKGFSLIFNGPDGKQYDRSTDKPLTVKRGVVTNLGTSGKDNVEIEAPYVTFFADEAQTFTFAKGSKVTIDAGLFEYSVNGGKWTTMVADTPITFGGADGDLRLRGKSPNGTSDRNGLNKSYNVKFGTTDVKVRCKGDIRTLIDYEKYLTANTRNARFERLFQGASPLVSAPELPATVLPEECCSYMFFACKQLKYSPDLKATTVGQNAYYCMFQSCKALKKAPEILATELIGRNNCYMMFAWCSALEESPSALYAETLQHECYRLMFQDCSSLKKDPVIKAVKIQGGNSHCCSMFTGCKSLETVQDVLFAEETVLFPNICQEMFRNCTSLKKAPALPSMRLGENCYSNMFFGCTSLTKTPKLPAETLVSNCYGSMFQNCTSLTEVWLNAKTNLSRGLSMYTFEGCPSTGVTAHIRKDRDYTSIGSLLEKPDWTYVDIETGEIL